MNAIYAGSFDPFTNGHLNVLNHAADIFDKVYVVVMEHPNKKRLVDVFTSKDLICKSLPSYLNNVDVIIAESNLIYKEAQRLDCDYIVRGIRNNGLDYSYEENLAEFNKDVGDVNTIFIRADVNKNVSSTMIKTLLINNEPISRYVPGPVKKYLKENYRWLLE
jgi:pantetheine-phosphate adenylyltransferase